MLALASWATLRAEVPQRRRIAGLALVLLAFVDGRTHMPELNPTIPRVAFVPRLLKLSPHPQLGEARAMISPFAENAFHQFGSSNALTDYLACRQGLYVNCNLLDDIPKVDGVYSLYLRHEEPIDQYLLKISPDPDRQFPALLNFLAVSQITAPGKYFDFEYRPEHMPMATAGQKPLFGEANTILKAVLSESFLPRHVVYLPESARGLVTVANETQAEILASRFTAHRAEIKVRANEACMLVVAQSCYHPWRAYVDKGTVPIFRANYAYQAIEIPGGLHQATLVYQDDIFHAAVFISVLTLVGCAATFLRMVT